MSPFGVTILAMVLMTVAGLGLMFSRLQRVVRRMHPATAGTSVEFPQPHQAQVVPQPAAVPVRTAIVTARRAIER